MSLNSPLANPLYWLNFFTDKTSRRSLLLSVIGIGLTTIASLCSSELAATQEPRVWSKFISGDQLGDLGKLKFVPTAYDRTQPNPQLLAQTAQKMLFVNPSVDNNKTGDGSFNAPFKTITQALQVAEANSVIVLAAGTYTAVSGETFPLQLKSGVSIQGDSKTKGRNIKIVGGGTFISPTFARQDVTILAANNASLIGVSVTNPHPRGYGLWIESSSPTVSDNTFTGSMHDGISITGNSAPIIRNNYFYQNGANGITIYGTSKPEVRENVFEQTGFGINIAQTAAPLLVGNRISKNRSGIVSQANAQPVLRNNVIENNTEDGLVAIANTQPDLGTKTQPGGNVFRQNGRYDINSTAKSQLISAFGNQLAQDRSIGNIDLTLTGTTTTNPQPILNNQIALNPPTNEKEQPSNTGETPSTSIPQPSPTQRSIVSSAKTNNTSPIEIPVPQLESTPQPKPNNPPQKISLIQSSKPNSGMEIPVPQLESTPQPKPSIESNKPNSAQSNPPVDIKILTSPPQTQPAPLPPPPKTDSLSQGLPVLEPAPINTSQLLPVPNSNIPVGNSSNQVKPQVLTRTIPTIRTQQALSAVDKGFRYRVVVEAASFTQQALVRSLVPGAFRTVSNGKAILQAGAFSDRAKAEEILQLLTKNGLQAAIEPLN